MNPVEIIRGDGPVVLGMPHTGTMVPEDVHARLNANGRALADTDWHIDRLYGGLLPDVTVVRADFHRYVIDANRDPSGGSLYPGQNTTGLVPMSDFDGRDIWIEKPGDEEVERRRSVYHSAYHAALDAELARVRQTHGVAILYDCHSIRSHIPFLFEGRLPDFNIGTAGGTSCAPAIEFIVRDICASADGFTSVLNGRFKGGWTTRRYGQPTKGIHAIQMELAQSTYLKNEADPWMFDDIRASRVRRHLASILTRLAELAPALS